MDKEEIIGIVKLEKEGTRTTCLFLSNLWSLKELDHQLDSFLDYYLDNEDWNAKKTDLELAYEMKDPKQNYKMIMPFEKLIEIKKERKNKE